MRILGRRIGKSGKGEKHKLKEEPKKKEEPKRPEAKKEGRGMKGQAEKEAAKAGQKPAKKKREFSPHVYLIPRFYLEWVERQLYLAGSRRGVEKFVWVVIILSLVIGAAAGAFFGRYFIYAAAAAFFIVFGMFNVALPLAVDRRRRFVDEILPDALQLLSANIRAGYIPSRALILSARKEFGPLADAIRTAGKEIMSGKSMEEGLREVPKSIKSKDLKRTIDLIIQGIRGGGQIVALLEENATDIRRRQAIAKEIKANTMMYAIFIAFAGCIGAPGLYALSGYLTDTITKLSPEAPVSGSTVFSSASFISFGGVSISPDFLFQFSIAAILITTFFGGLILGLISSGRERDGLKFAPILALIALLVFFGASFAVSTLFSTMLPV
jgi:Flp pilus assembly protein TadB